MARRNKVRYVYFNIGNFYRKRFIQYPFKKSSYGISKYNYSRRYSGGQNKVGQVLLRNLAKIELSKPGLL
jgi:hypothetical protein